MLTSLPCTMRWCVVIRALKTTTQLALPALSISVSAIWGTLTVVSWEAWIRSVKHRGDKSLSTGTTFWETLTQTDGGRKRQMVVIWQAGVWRIKCDHVSPHVKAILTFTDSPNVLPWAVFPQITSARGMRYFDFSSTTKPVSNGCYRIKDYYWAEEDNNIR